MCMRLEGLWEVSLVEIQYPYTFFIENDDSNKLELVYNLPSVDDKKIHTKSINIKIGSDINALISVVNEAILNETKEDNFFRYDVNIMRVYVKPNKERIIADGNKLVIKCMTEGRLACLATWRGYCEGKICFPCIHWSS